MEWGQNRYGEKIIIGVGITTSSQPLLPSEIEFGGPSPATTVLPGVLHKTTQLKILWLMSDVA